MCDATCLQAELVRFTKLIGGANGRDKFSKAIQYGSKLLFYILLTSARNEEGTIIDESKLNLSKQMKSLSGGVSTARKCNRLLKSLIEINKILTLLTSNNDDSLLTGLKIAFAFCYSLYWYYDNKVFLGKIGYWKDLDIKSNTVRGSRWWLLGLVFNFFILTKTLSKLEAKKRQESKSNRFVGPTQSEITDKRLALVSWCGDTLCASTNAQMIEKILGYAPNDGILGAAGLSSACITLYRIYPNSK